MPVSVSDPNMSDLSDVILGELIADGGHGNGAHHDESADVVAVLTGPAESTGATVAMASGEPAAPLVVPPFPIPKRLVSGRYRGRTGGFELELRVDVDGAAAMNKVSGDYLSIQGSTTTYFGSWQVVAPTVSVTPSMVSIEGTATTTWNSSYTKLRLTIPRRTWFQPAADGTVTWFNAANAQGATYVCPWESSRFRTVYWEQDSVVGAVPFASYDTGSLPQPPGSAPRILSVPNAYAEAGIEMVVAGTPNVISNAAAGADARWNESEMHAAMVANFSLWADVPQWKVYTLVASRYTDDGVRGIMFDYADAHQRQGMAVFHNAIQGADPASQRAQLRTYVHELGHCFNLLHSWDKNLASPPQPLGPNGGLGDLSWMNYAWKYQPLPPAPGGEPAYWANFPFRFTNNELVHLRHGLRNNVIMGGAAFGMGAGDIDPIIFADREADHSGLALELRASSSYMLGEPVVVELKLSSTDRRGTRTHGYLHPRDGLVHIAIQRPSGQVVAYRPLMPRCVDQARTVQLGEDAIYDSAYIGFGADGFTFEQPGFYRLRATYVADDGSHIVSPTIRIRVRSPLTAADDRVADLLFADGQGQLLYLLGSDSPSLQGANDAMSEIATQYADHPMAVFARLVKGTNDERDFKTVTVDKALVVRSARPAEAVSELTAVADASASGHGVDNITLNEVLRRKARAEQKAGDVEQANATLDGMVDVFRAKGVKDSVLRTIAGQAAREKVRLDTEG